MVAAPSTPSRAPGEGLIALNTAENMANLFQQTGRVKEAEELYRQALVGIKAGFRRLSDRYRGLIKVLDALSNNSKHNINYLL
jgi:hypothetical protein